MDEVEVAEEPVPAAEYAEQLAVARRGLRSCLGCRTAFPNRLALLKHQLAGCTVVKK